MSESADEEQREPSVLGSSAVMAAGTVVSRLSGFLRSTLLAAALGTQLHADTFNISNTIPNMLYILLAGGVVNAVLVPQLVRAMQPKGGERQAVERCEGGHARHSIRMPPACHAGNPPAFRPLRRHGAPYSRPGRVIC